MVAAMRRHIEDLKTQRECCFFVENIARVGDKDALFRTGVLDALMMVCVAQCFFVLIDPYSRFLLDCPVRFAPHIPVVEISKSLAKTLTAMENRYIAFGRPAPKTSNDIFEKSGLIRSRNPDVT